MARFEINPKRSTVLVAARSSMGPIGFETQDLRGWIDVDVADGTVDLASGVGAEVEIELESLRSGNDLYDAELRRRIDVRRYPLCRLTLSSAAEVADGRFALTGDIEMHGRTRRLVGELVVEEATPTRLALTGAKELDIRDFRIEAPGMLMMKIYPEVQVQVFFEALTTETRGPEGS